MLTYFEHRDLPIAYDTVFPVSKRLIGISLNFSFSNVPGRQFSEPYEIDTNYGTSHLLDSDGLSATHVSVFETFQDSLLVEPCVESLLQSCVFGTRFCYPDYAAFYVLLPIFALVLVDFYFSSYPFHRARFPILQQRQVIQACFHAIGYLFFHGAGCIDQLLDGR